MVMVDAMPARHNGLFLAPRSQRCRRGPVPTKQLVKKRHHAGGVLVGERVINCLGVTTRRDKSILPQTGEMLRQGGLAEADRLNKRADRSLAVVQFAEHHKAVLAGERLEEGFGLLSLGEKLFYIHAT